MFKYRSILFVILILLICILRNAKSIKKPSNIFKGNQKWRDLEKGKGTKGQEMKVANAYQDLASYLKRYDYDGELQSYYVNEIEAAVQSLAASQAALKSMDGLTHQLKNTFKKRQASSVFSDIFSYSLNSTSLQSRFENFIRKKSRNTKEAAKIREYIATVERTLQATEILQDISISNTNERADGLSDIDLQEVSRFSVDHNKVHCLVSICVPTSQDNESTPLELRRYYPNEIIISIIDEVKSEAISISQLLRLMNSEKPEKIYLDDSHSLFIQPTFLEISLKIVEKLDEVIIRNKSTSASPFLSIGNSASDNNVTMIPIQRVRVLGHSSGAGVSAYVSMLLDGSLNPHDYLEERYPISSPQNESMILNETISMNVSPQHFTSLIGKFNGRVRAYLLGCPPCISRSIVPKFISTIINGDDVVARTQSSSLQAFRRRVMRGLEAGIGKKSITSLLSSTTGLLKDIKAMTGKGLSNYKKGKKLQEQISLPGRVFFIKSRQLKDGATIQRVLRGNWQEDLFWTLHEILISPKMFEHHSLNAYIRTLNRC